MVPPAKDEDEATEAHSKGTETIPPPGSAICTQEYEDWPGCSVPDLDDPTGN